PCDLDDGAERHHRGKTRIDQKRDRVSGDRGERLDHSRAAVSSGSGYRPTTKLIVSTSATPTACRPRETAMLRPSRSEPGNQRRRQTAAATASGQKGGVAPLRIGPRAERRTTGAEPAGAAGMRGSTGRPGRAAEGAGADRDAR